MKHCVLITVYKNPDVCNHLIETMPEGWGAYVHIDAKSDIETKNIHPRAHTFKKYKIYWGAIEHLQAFLFLMAAAAESGENYDYYHLISGEDYWAMSPAKFDQAIQEGKSYVEVHPLPRPGWHNGGYDILKYRTLASKGDVRKGLLSFGNKFLKLWQIISYSTNSLPDYPVSCGSVYCTLYIDAVQEIINGKLAANLLKRLEGTCLGEEVFIQTVLMNSILKDSIVNNCMRYIDWSVTPAPKYLTEEDLEKTVSSGDLFCRKIENIALANQLDSTISQ